MAIRRAQRQRERNEQRAREEMTANQVHADYASAERADGVTFTQGNMRVDGVNQIPTRVEHWESSNGTTQYTTVEWRDAGNTVKRASCNCPGWSFKRKGKPRKCKHTDAIMAIKDCDARKIDTVTITTAQQAEHAIPKFDGRELRGIMLD